MVLHTRRKATPARNLFPFKVPTFLLRKCTVIGPFFPQIYIPDSKEKSALLPLFHFWPLSADTKDVFLRTWPFCPYGTLRHDDWRDCNEYSCYFCYSMPQLHCVFSSLAEAPWASSRETTENVFWQRILAKSGVFCHRWDNHSHIDKNVGKTKRSK